MTIIMWTLFYKSRPFIVNVLPFNLNLKKYLQQIEILLIIMMSQLVVSYQLSQIWLYWTASNPYTNLGAIKYRKVNFRTNLGTFLTEH